MVINNSLLSSTGFAAVIGDTLVSCVPDTAETATLPRAATQRPPSSPARPRSRAAGSHECDVSCACVGETARSCRCERKRPSLPARAHSACVRVLADFGCARGRAYIRGSGTVSSEALEDGVRGKNSAAITERERPASFNGIITGSEMLRGGRVREARQTLRLRVGELCAFSLA